MIGNSWDEILKYEYKKKYYKELLNYIESEYSAKTVYPPKDKIFNAFKMTPFNKVKVVIIGQDPYHQPHQAEGLSFSVSNEVIKPPSLKNIFKELENDLSIPFPEHNSLTNWAKEGVLLLNSVLTVEESKPTSHKNKGWEIFTDKVIEKLNLNNNPIVFILWGEFAKQKQNLITNKKHKIITSPHPSPFSARRGFFGSKPFSRANEFLKENNIKEINWKI